MAKLVVAIVLGLVWIRGAAWAILPAFISDAELAKYPVIVVGQWEKAPFQAHNRVEVRGGERVNTALEAYTEFKVVRVIRGKIEPGMQKLKVGYGISWSQNGDRVSSGTSTDVPAAVGSVAEPVIWFLQQERSWDPKDEKTYFAVSNFREVQPVRLEQYFAALSAEKPAEEIAKLFESDEPEVLRNVLNLVAGESWPWPYGSSFDEFIRGKRERNPIVGDQSAGVKGIIERRKLKEVRPLAVAVYADLQGAKCVEDLRGLLADADAEVRSVAAAILLQQRDAGSIAPLTKALTGAGGSSVVCPIIQAAAKWGDLRLAPILISFLENETFAGSRGDDIDLPALKARQALHKMVGSWFPYDVEAAGMAWEKTEGAKGDKARKQALAKLLPGKECPVKAELIGDGTVKARCKITNVSAEVVVLSKVPDSIGLEWPRGVSGAAFEGAGEIGKADFIHLKPGEFVEFPAKLDENFLESEVASRAVKLEYLHTGQKWQQKAWVGIVKAKFGAGWKEEQKIEKIEEKWPNGNLKAVGKTRNGKKTGEWTYYNFYGDRIRTEDHTNGGSAKYDPDQPDSHGAGKRTK